MSLEDALSYNRSTRHQSLRRTTRKFVIYDDFETNRETGVTTILGQHVICAADELILTGFNVSLLPDDVNSGFTFRGNLRQPKNVRRTLLENLVHGIKKKSKKMTAMFVTQKAVWSMNPYEPIVPETKGQYDASRRYFWIMFAGMFLTLAASLGCLYTFIFTCDISKLSNQSASEIKEPRKAHEKEFVWHFFLHAIIMSSGVYLNAGISNNIYRIVVIMRKSRVKWIHGICGLFSVALSVGGTLIIYWAHDHYEFDYGPHSYIGYATVACLVLQFLGGFTAFVRLTTFSVQVELAAFHRFFGNMIFFMIAFQSLSGIIAFMNIFLPSEEAATFSGRSILVNAAGVLMIVASVLMMTLTRGARFQRRTKPKLGTSGPRHSSRDSHGSLYSEDGGEEARNSEDVHVEGAKIGELYYGALIHQYKYQ